MNRRGEESMDHNKFHILYSIANIFFRSDFYLKNPCTKIKYKRPLDPH